MSTINEKLGLRRAGKRSMMKLPKNRAAAAKITAAECPHCHQRGKATISATKGLGWLFCTWCSHVYERPA
jgi:transcription elongation factor Elf1